MKTFNYFLGFQIVLTSIFVLGFLRVAYGLLTGECTTTSFGLYN